MARSARPISQQAIGAAVRSEAWAATPAMSSRLVMVASSGGSTPSAEANEAIHSEAVRSWSAMPRPYADPVAEEPGRLRVSSTLVLPLSELSWRFSRSGGPGGQHANTSDTRAEVRFNIATSPTLGPRQRARLQERFGDELRVVASDERSQARNRDLALERLAARLGEALRVTTPRRATAPSKASVQRRLEAKRRQSNRKADRRRPPAD